LSKAGLPNGDNSNETPRRPSRREGLPDFSIMSAAVEPADALTTQLCDASLPGRCAALPAPTFAPQSVQRPSAAFFSSLSLRLTIRLSDAGLHQRQSKALYPNHRSPPWFIGDDTPRSLEPFVRHLRDLRFDHAINRATNHRSHCDGETEAYQGPLDCSQQSARQKSGPRKIRYGKH
jgi:hypothetical protein